MDQAIIQVDTEAAFEEALAFPNTTAFDAERNMLAVSDVVSLDMNLDNKCTVVTEYSDEKLRFGTDGIDEADAEIIAVS
jgi:hypothetical protein